MRKSTKLRFALALTLILSILATTAFALPKPRTAHYPRGGMFTLSSTKETTNSYAFKATCRSDSRVHLQIRNAYAEQDEASVSFQIFVVNRWGNWVAFGAPEIITIGSESSSYDLYFTIRARKAFCIVVSAYGMEDRCVIPYHVTTD
jgi:hypothetical protein